MIDRLADDWEAAWSGRDAAAFAGICAPDVHYEDPLTAAPLQGPEAIAGHAARAWGAFPDLRMDRGGDRLGGGRFVALPVKLSGTNTAPLEALPPSGASIALHAVFYCELDPEGRLLWRVRAFFDAYAAGVELGILPRRGSLRERALLMIQGYGLRLGR
ncbi:MAG: nuclear transport factor 2 family protein [Solirubrobacteraceae bacterium]